MPLKYRLVKRLDMNKNAADNSKLFSIQVRNQTKTSLVL